MDTKFFSVLAEHNTFILSNMPPMISAYSKFKSVNPIAIFPRHIYNMTPEAILKYGASYLPNKSKRYFNNRE